MQQGWRLGAPNTSECGRAAPGGLCGSERALARGRLSHRNGWFGGYVSAGSALSPSNAFPPSRDAMPRQALSAPAAPALTGLAGCASQADFPRVSLLAVLGAEFTGEKAFRRALPPSGPDTELPPGGGLGGYAWEVANWASQHRRRVYGTVTHQMCGGRRGAAPARERGRRRGKRRPSPCGSMQTRPGWSPGSRRRSKSPYRRC